MAKDREKFDISTESERNELKLRFGKGKKAVAWTGSSFFTIEKTGGHSYVAYYSSVRTGIVSATGSSEIEAINNVSQLAGVFSSSSESE